MNVDLGGNTLTNGYFAGVLLTNNGVDCITLGKNSSASGQYNSTAPRWKVNTYDPVTRIVILESSFDGEFVAGNRVILDNSPDGTIGISTIESVDPALNKIVLETNPGVGAIEEDGGSLTQGVLLGNEGENARAEGGVSTATGFDSHAEGERTNATGRGSHAEGYNSTAFGSGSHAEGMSTLASGTNSHAEGQNSTALGASSHAGGSFGRAFWRDSFARGANSKVQYITVPLLAETSNATQRPMNQFSPLNIDEEGLFACEATITAARNDMSANAMFVRRFLIKRAGSTVSLVGSVQTLGTDMGSDAGLPPSGWAVAAAADDTNKRILILVTGAASMQITWGARLDVVHIVP